MMSQPRRFTCPMIASLAIVLVVSGCRAPKWCSLRGLHCLPNSADHSASNFWAQCGSPVAQQSNDPAAQGLASSAGRASEQTQSDGSQSATLTSQDRAAEPALSSSRTLRQTSGIPAQTIAYTRAAASPVGAEETLGSPDQNAANPQERPGQQQPNPFQLPSVLPGAEAPPLRLPPMGSSPNDAQDMARQRAFQSMFRPPIALPSLPDADPNAASGIYGLEELQLLARDNNPRLREAAAAVETARGLMIQAGLPPNPKVGYEAEHRAHGLYPGL